MIAIGQMVVQAVVLVVVEIQRHHQRYVLGDVINQRYYRRLAKKNKMKSFKLFAMQFGIR